MRTSDPGATTLSHSSETVPSDGDAVDAELAASGDAHAFERLYRRHVTRVHNLARRMVGGDEVDDLTQAVFVRAWQKLSTFRGEAAFGTWLHRLAVNLILAKRGVLGVERRRYEDGEMAFERMAAKHPSRELRLDFETAMLELPDGARRVFVLHDVEGYKHEEIAGMLGITAGTSKSQLHHARMALRKCLDR
jgi:RNA polymerase sigma-70 factor (ECF subfamily)